MGITSQIAWFNLGDIMNIKEKIDAVFSMDQKWSLSDEYLKGHGHTTREELGIGGEFSYGIPMVTTDVVIELIRHYEQQSNQLQEDAKNIKKDLIEKVCHILNGIDKDESSHGSGWWETSTGVNFGKYILSQIIELGND
jgi:hypothetical protein